VHEYEGVVDKAHRVAKEGSSICEEAAPGASPTRGNAAAVQHAPVISTIVMSRLLARSFVLLEIVYVPGLDTDSALFRGISNCLPGTVHNARCRNYARPPTLVEHQSNHRLEPKEGGVGDWRLA
jgi:hypothetical protein